MARGGNICCTAICLACSIAAIVTCILFAVHAKYEMGYPYHLWYWCVIYGGLIVLAVINTIVKLMFPREEIIEVKPSSTGDNARLYLKRYVYNYENPIDSLLRLAELGMFIWGCIIYSYIGMSGKPYDENLWTWFQVMFWFLVAWLILACCAICCAGCTICVAGIMSLADHHTDPTHHTEHPVIFSSPPTESTV
jgi:MFS family permease